MLPQVLFDLISNECIVKTRFDKKKLLFKSSLNTLNDCIWYQILHHCWLAPDAIAGKQFNSRIVAEPIFIKSFCCHNWVGSVDSSKLWPSIADVNHQQKVNLKQRDSTCNHEMITKCPRSAAVHRTLSQGFLLHSTGLRGILPWGFLFDSLLHWQLSHEVKCFSTMVCITFNPKIWLIELTIQATPTCCKYHDTMTLCTVARPLAPKLCHWVWWWHCHWW